MSKLPSENELLEWVRQNPDRAGKREIARAFGLKGPEKVALKHMIRKLQDDGHLKQRRRKLHEPGALPPVGVLEVTAWWKWCVLLPRKRD